MLTAPEIVEVAHDFRDEVKKRQYVNLIMAPGFVDDSHSWQMVIEVIEVVLHRRGLYIVPQTLLKDDVAPRIPRL